MGDVAFSVSEFSKAAGLPVAQVRKAIKALPKTASVAAIAAALFNEFSQADEDTEPIASISEIARLTGLDRATVSRRLDDIDSTPGPKGGKMYMLADALPVLIAGESPGLDESKERKLAAEASMAEHKLAIAREEYVEIEAVKDYAQKLFNSMHQKVAIQYPGAIAAQVHKAATKSEVADILKTGINKIFVDLRTDHESFL